MTDQLFNDPNENQDHTPENVLNELVGEGKKFKDAEALARGKWESDRYIERVLREQKELRDELAKRMSAEEVAAQISAKLSQRPASNEPQPGQDERDDTKNIQSMSPEEIKSLVDKEIETNKQKQLQVDNLEMVRSELEKVWGPNYIQHLKNKTRELGLGEDFANGFAATKPKAFLKLVLDKTSPVTDFSPPASSVRPSSGFSQGKKYKDYEQMRKDNPTQYFSPRVQNEMHAEAMRQGEDFYK